MISYFLGHHFVISAYFYTLPRYFLQQPSPTWSAHFNVSSAYSTIFPNILSPSPSSGRFSLFHLGCVYLVTNFSGCGIIPNTLPSLFVTAAMPITEPLGFSG